MKTKQQQLCRIPVSVRLQLFVPLFICRNALNANAECVHLAWTECFYICGCVVIIVGWLANCQRQWPPCSLLLLPLLLRCFGFDYQPQRGEIFVLAFCRNSCWLLLFLPYRTCDQITHVAADTKKCEQN